MKLKLKVSKALKRELKVLASKKEMERPDFVITLLQTYIDDNKSVWEDKIKTYASFLVDREKNLEKLKLELEESDKTIEEQRSELKAFYTANKMYRAYDSQKRKFENIIISINEEQYFALMIIADKNETTIESNTVSYLQRYIKTSN